MKRPSARYRAEYHVPLTPPNDELAAVQQDFAALRLAERDALDGKVIRAVTKYTRGSSMDVGLWCCIKIAHAANILRRLEHRGILISTSKGDQHSGLCRRYYRIKQWNQHSG